ncbi:MAG TPA: hypothetical protein VGF98_03180 [Candidatus Tumulicola sp.]
MHDFGLVVWAIVIFAGVVSSIVKSARRNAPAKTTQSAGVAGTLAEARRIAESVTVRVGPGGATVLSPRPASLAPTPPGGSRAQAAPARQAPPSASPSAPTAPVAPAAPMPASLVIGAAEPMMHLIDERPPRRTSAIDALLSNRRRLADAVILSEVIGKPLALRNE